MTCFKKIVSMLLVVIMVMSLLPLSVIAEDIQNTHTVQFKLNYNGAHKIPSQKVADGECAVQPEDVTREGWIFEYWYVKTEDNGIQKFDLSQPITEDVTLYARWDEDIEYWGPIWNRNIVGAIEDSKEDEENTDGTYTVTFEANADGVVGMPENQKVAAGEYAVEPTAPKKDGYLFLAWYINKNETDYSNFFDFENTIIDKNTTLYAIWVNIELDTDKDGLPDTVEDKIGTNINKIDSDDDGLSDYIEVMQLGTNPTLKDTDSNGIDDADEDHDGDGISNIDEVRCGTSPVMEDSDMDGLKDNEEIQLGTDPMNADSDTDGADDGIEIEYGFNPLVANDSFIDSDEAQEISEFFPVTASVEAEVCGKVFGTVAVNPLTYIDNPFISKTIPGYMGYAFEFTAADEIESATLTFEYDTALGEIGDDFQPRVYYFNPETQGLEELPDQTVTQGKISVPTDHFSTYILLNKVEYDKTQNSNNTIYINEETIDSNDDMISDKYNELIYWGEITLASGATTFAGVDFSVSADIDNDGLLNGEEIEIWENENGKLVIFMNSNPIFPDSDFDGIDDKSELENGISTFGLQRFIEPTQNSNNFLYSFNADGINGLIDDTNYPYAEMVDDLYADWIHGILTSGGEFDYGSLSDIFVYEWIEYLTYYADNALVQYENHEIVSNIINNTLAIYDDYSNQADALLLMTKLPDAQVDLLGIELQKIWSRKLYISEEMTKNFQALKASGYTDEAIGVFSLKHAELAAEELQLTQQYEFTTKLRKGITDEVVNTGGYSKVQNITDKLDIVTIVITTIDGLSTIDKVRQLYARANSQYAAFEGTRDIFYKIGNRSYKQIISSEVIGSKIDKDFEKEVMEAVATMLKVLNAGAEEAYKELNKIRDNEMTREMQNLIIDLVIIDLALLLNPYAALIAGITQIVIDIILEGAYQKNVVIANAYLTEGAVRVVEDYITQSGTATYAVKNNNVYYCQRYMQAETVFFLTHLAQMRLVTELKYDSVNNDTDFMKKQKEKITGYCDQLMIYISKSLILSCDSVTNPNVIIKAYDYISPRDPNPVNPSKHIIESAPYVNIYLDDVRINRTTNDRGICNLALKPGEYKLMVEYDRLTHPGYKSFTRYITIEKGQKYTFDFNLYSDVYNEDMTISGTVYGHNSTTGIESAIKILKGYGNRTAQDEYRRFYTGSNGSFSFNLPVGAYTAEITADGHSKKYVDFIVSENITSFNINMEFNDTYVCGYIMDENNNPIEADIMCYRQQDLMDVLVNTFSSDKTGYFKGYIQEGIYNFSVYREGYSGGEVYKKEIKAGKNDLGTITIEKFAEENTFTIMRGSENLLQSNPVIMQNKIYEETWTITSSLDYEIATYGNWFATDIIASGAGTNEITIYVNKTTETQNDGRIYFKVGDNISGYTTYEIILTQTYTPFSITHTYNNVTTDILAASPIEVYNGIAPMTWTINSSEPWKIVTNRGDWFSLSVDGKSVGLNSTFDAGETELVLNITKYTDSRNDGTIAFEVGGETRTVEIFQKASIITSLTGTIKDGDADSPTYGQVLEGVSLDVYDSTGKKVGDTAKSNENGIVAFDFPAADTYKFVFSLVGYETVTVDTVIINENTPSLGQYVMMRAEANTSVSGTTTPGTKLELLDENGNVLAETVADENGKYEFTDIPGWDGTIFRIRIKDTTVTVDTVGGATGVVVDTTVTIFTISKPDTVQIGNEVGATSEWEIESSHAWSVTATGDTSWYTLSSTSGECGTTEFTVTANSVTDAYRESVLTFALNNRTFDVKIYQDIARTTVAGTTTPGTKLELLDENGNVIAETITDENGNYDFGDIPGWDGTIFIIRIKDTTLTTEVTGGSTDVVIDASKVIFIPTISYESDVMLENTDGASTEWEIETSHPWTVTKSGDTSWYTLNTESGNAGISDFVVTAIGTTDSYRESTLTFALNNRTFDVTIYQNFVKTVSGSVVEQTENSAEAGIENVEIVVRKADDSSLYSQTETNVNGQYTLVFEDAGEYVITAEKSGYTTVMVDFSVSSETAEIEKISMVKTNSPYYFNGHTYLPIFASDSSISWDDAEAICQSFGGHLVSITSEDENNFIKALTEDGLSNGIYTYTRERWWIGAHKENGSWAWSDGDSFGSYTNWMGEPESAAMYGFMYSKTNDSQSGYWQNIQDDGTQYAGLICEWDYEIDSIEGVCNNNLTWQFTLDGTLTISGEGILDNNGYNTAPWKDLEYNITKVELTSGITEIGQYGFTDTYYATEVILPDTLKTINEYPSYINNGYRKNYTVSADNTAYTSVNGVLFTKDMTTLVAYPQYNERTEYSIPDGVNVIKSLNGNALQIINIPASVSDWNITNISFNSLQEFNVDPDNTIFSSIDGVLFDESGNSLVKYPRARFAENNTYRIPDGVTTINNGAFYEFGITDYDYDKWNAPVGSIIFPASVTTIGYNNFFFEEYYHYPHMNLYFEGNAPVIDGYYNWDNSEKIVEYATVYYTAGKSGWTSPNWYPSYKEWSSETKLTNIRIPTILQDAYTTVSGQVVDESGAPLENVKVQGKYGDEFTGIAYTDSEGNYTFQFESVATCDFRYYLSGYETVFVDTVAIVGGEYSLDTVTMTTGVSVLGSGTTGGGNNWTLQENELIIVCGESNSSGMYELSSYDNEAIQEYSFWSPNDMMQIRKLNISEGITKLRISGISNNLSVEELYIGADVCEIDLRGNSFVLDYRDGDTEIVIDSANTNYVITDGALYTSDHKTLLLAPQNNYSITTYSIREGVEVVGKYAFNGANYKTINIPNTVFTLESSSFFACDLESIHIPASVTSIDGNVFESCHSLSVITVETANTEYMAVDNILYNKAQTMLIAVPCTLTGTLSIPNGINSIGSEAMYNTKLDRIIIPTSVASIDSYAIYPHYSNQNCKVYFLGGVPNTVSKYAFGYDFEGTLYYLAGSSGWSTPTTVINGTTYNTQPFTMDELN